MQTSDSKPCDEGNPSTYVATAPRAKKRISKRKLVFLLKFLITALVMIILIKNVESEKIVTALANAKTFLFGLTLLLLAPNIYLQYYKWNYLLKLTKPKVTFYESISSLLAGFTFGFITPGRVGEFGRAFFIRDCPWIKILGLAFIDKLFSLAVVFILGALGLLLLVGHLFHFYLLLPILIFTSFTVIFILYLISHPDLIRGFLYRINIILPFREKIKLLISSLDNFHRKQALTLFGLAILFYSVFALQFYILILAFEPIAPHYAFMAIASTLLVKSLLPISLGDLGIRESAAIFFFAKVGVMDATAFNASIMLFVINILIPSLAGLVLVLRHKLLNQSAPADLRSANSE